jgi:hypothetical protein
VAGLDDLVRRTVARRAAGEAGTPAACRHGRRAGGDARSRDHVVITRADDRTLAELRERHPGWNIWFVPQVGGTIWCAQPRPLLNCASARQLE